MKKKFVFIVLFVWSAISVSFAKVYYFTPQQIPALKQLLGGESLRPGDEILLRDGVYRDLGDVDFIGRGTFIRPIIWKAEHPGKAVLSGQLDIRLCGEYLQLEGLLFYQAWPASGKNMIDFQKQGWGYANRCRITNCVIDDCNDVKKGSRPGGGEEYWVVLRGENNRIDHCYFANKRVGGLVLQVWLEKNNHLNNHSIDHNFFGERRPYGGNGAEIIRIGHSWSSQWESRTLVENNVFFRCSGENEIISVKSCHNIVRKNLFYESGGGLVCRHGHYNVLESNTFIGNHQRGTAGIRVINQGHTIYDNYIRDVEAFGLLVRMGVFERPTPDTDVKKEPLTSYHRVENVDIAYNIFLNCSLELGSGYGDKLPKNVRFAHNLYGGERPDWKIIHPENVLPHFTFSDNLWTFKEDAPLDSIPFERIRLGFTPTDYPESLVSEERKRIESCLSVAGPSWYQPFTNDVNYINEHKR